MYAHGIFLGNKSKTIPQKGKLALKSNVQKNPFAVLK
jgi:hypothetical protein